MPAALVPILVGAGLSTTVATGVVAVATIAISVGLSFLAQKLMAEQDRQKPSDMQGIIKASAQPRFRAYGRVKVAGTLVFAETAGGSFYRVLAMGSGEIDAVEEHWLDEIPVTLDGSNFVQEATFFSGGVSMARIDFRLGQNNPAVYAQLNAAFTQWTNNHLGKGVPSAYIRLYRPAQADFPIMFPARENTLYRQVQRASKVRGLSAGAFTAEAWSENAAEIIMDYLTHDDGLRLSDSFILAAATDWQQAINDCNNNITLDAGGTEDRYRIWGTYTFDERPADVLERMLAACDGYLFATQDGGIGLKVGKWETPTVTLDENSIVAFSDIGKGRDILTTANTIKATFTYPDHDYRETDADPWVDNADVTARGEYSTDRELLMVPSHTQCRRLMKIAAHRANPNWTGTITTNLRGLAVLGERFIDIDFPLLGINESFEVLEVQFLIEGTVLKGLTLEVASMSSDAYAWDETTEEGTPPVVPDDIPRAA